MCGFVVTKQNPLTMHHIIPKSDGGKGTIENSSNVTNLPHVGIHILYNDDPRKKKLIIDYLRYYKATKDELARLDFYEWFTQQMIEYEYEPVEGKNKILTYRKIQCQNKMRRVKK